MFEICLAIVHTKDTKQSTKETDKNIHSNIKTKTRNYIKQTNNRQKCDIVLNCGTVKIITRETKG